MLNTISMQFFQHMSILVALYLGRMLFRIAGCAPFKEGGEEFNLKHLLLGIAKNTLVLLGISIVYIVGLTFGPDLMVITLGETSVTIPMALDMIIIAAIAVYGAKFIENVREYFTVKELTQEAAPSKEYFNIPDDYAERG